MGASWDMEESGRDELSEERVGSPEEQAAIARASITSKAVSKIFFIISLTFQISTIYRQFIIIAQAAGKEKSKIEYDLQIASLAPRLGMVYNHSVKAEQENGF